ncbi:MAG: protein phosphatase 2C domain-containing protein [Thermoproteaceae archaeon]|jgi:protein phosphatase|nr:protein phosphatase 2C domain-containing protein [Thermoproteaceae archaeon]
MIRAVLYALERLWAGEVRPGSAWVDCSELLELGVVRRAWGCRGARAVGGVYSHRGPRRNNEDASLAAIAPEHFAAVAVADGVGGLRAGEVASYRAICVVLKSLAEAAGRLGVFSQRWFEELFNNAHEETVKSAGGGATTLSIAVYDLNAHILHVANVGDSVVYLTPDVLGGSAEGYRLLTTELDETYNASGRFVTQALGHKTYRGPHYKWYSLGGYEDVLKVIIAASDGVDDFIDRALYSELPRRFRECKSAGSLAKLLVCSAVARGGRDNATAAVLAILPTGT